MRFGIIGSGSWATALAKILTDNNNRISWLFRTPEQLSFFKQRNHNAQYLPSVSFNHALVNSGNSIEAIIAASDVLVLATPSAYLENTLAGLDRNAFEGKKMLSAIKGMVPGKNQLMHIYLNENFGVDIQDFFTVMGPCHAEEVAGEKLSYLTFSGLNNAQALQISDAFKSDYIHPIINADITGVQYAAILKNIYALGAGIAHGLKYGDNFLSVFIANAADEMAGFLKKVGISGMGTNYAASVYLGDLLVTCYSLFSRNRTFGNMIGKGYSVKSAQLEMNMVAEGHNASKSIYRINEEVQADMPIARIIYEILWEGMSPGTGFKKIEAVLI